MIKKIKTGVLFVSSGICLLLYQNCSMQHGGAMQLDSVAAGISNQTSASIPAAVAGDSIEAQAITLLQNRCYSCHGTATAGGVSQINNPAYLISIGQIIPGNPTGSPLYTAVSSGAMPLGSAALTTAELQILNSWILAGANAPSDGSVTGPVVIPLAGNYKSIQANIIGPKCLSCHSSGNASDGVVLDSYNAVKRYVSSTTAKNTKLYSITASGEMPPQKTNDLNADELKALNDWIVAGALND